MDEDLGPGTRLEVVSYAGHKGDERPVRFRLGSTEYFVAEIVEQWRGPEHAYFLVRVEGGGACLLCRSTVSPEGGWTLEWSRPE